MFYCVLSCRFIPHLLLRALRGLRAKQSDSFPQYWVQAPPADQKSQIANQKCVHAVLFVANRPFGCLARKEGPLPTPQSSSNRRHLSNNSWPARTGPNVTGNRTNELFHEPEPIPHAQAQSKRLVLRQDCAMCYWPPEPVKAIHDLFNGLHAAEN